MTTIEAPDLADRTALRGALALPALGVIAARGEDAAAFLHGQLTQDVSLQPLSEARLAAYCSAKGRMLASFVVVKRAHDELLLVCRRDLLPATLKRLAMFVLRAKVRLSDVSGEEAVHGLAGDAVPAALGSAPWTCLADGPARLVRLHTAQGVARALWIGPPAAAPAGAALAPGHWDWLEVQSGVATLGAAVVEAFVPQMLNYESVGGVNFKKGCYPGQEVVARSQFRGTLKRRAYLVHAPGPLAAGQEVFHDSDPGQPCGMVVQAAPHPAAGWDAIVSMQTAAAAGGALRAADLPLTLLPLPYPLLDDI